MPQLDMHKREWFAGQAMLGLIANPNRVVKNTNETEDQFAVRVATLAYQYADAMLHVGYRKESRQ